MARGSRPCVLRSSERCRTLVFQEKESGRQVFDVLGVGIELINGALISKRDQQRVPEKIVDGICDLNARAAASSYFAERLDVATGRINAPVCDVRSAEARVLEHTYWRAEVSCANSQSGGRPRR